MAKRKRRKAKPISLALAGGGPFGAIHEIGALMALQESLEGIDFADLDVYVGVSAGSFRSASRAAETISAPLAAACTWSPPTWTPARASASGARAATMCRSRRRCRRTRRWSASTPTFARAASGRRDRACPARRPSFGTPSWT